MYCPTCAQWEPWVGRVLEAYEGIRAGLRLEDVAPDATDAMVAGITLASQEIELRNAMQRKDRLTR